MGMERLRGLYTVWTVWELICAGDKAGGSRAANRSHEAGTLTAKGREGCQFLGKRKPSFRDGVILGEYETSLEGCDRERNSPSRRGSNRGTKTVERSQVLSYTEKKGCMNKKKVIDVRSNRRTRTLNVLLEE